MVKKVTITLAIVLVAVGTTVPVFAGAIATWAPNPTTGPFAYTKAVTFVPGGTPEYCADQKVYPFTWPTLPVSSTCIGIRPGFTGGAWATAYCNIIGGRKYASAASGTWGPWTWAGKADGDTTRCSTYVDMDVVGTILDMNVYAYLKSKDRKQMSTVKLDVTAGRDTLFHGLVTLIGDPPEIVTDGSFSPSDVQIGADDAQLERAFSGIDLHGYDPDSVRVTAHADSGPKYSVPSTSWPGLAALVAALIIVALYFGLWRRGRLQKISA